MISVMHFQVFGVQIFDEKYYICIPPCLWGSVEEGLHADFAVF